MPGRTEKGQGYVIPSCRSDSVSLCENIVRERDYSVQLGLTFIIIIVFSDLLGSDRTFLEILLGSHHILCSVTDISQLPSYQSSDFPPSGFLAEKFYANVAVALQWE